MKSNERKKGEEMKTLVEETKNLNTVSTLEKDLKDLGLKEGMIVLVHSSLSNIGWVNGGAIAVIQALQNVITEEGTIVMPGHSSDLSDPSRWGNPPVPVDWWQEIKDTMPAYDPKTTPTSWVGKIPEAFRNFPKVERSAHPSASFTAWGKYRQKILANHSLDFGLGDESPLASLYGLDAKVLFIGTTYETNTIFHLGEYRSRTRKVIQDGARIMVDGKPKWTAFKELDYQDEEFEKVGKLFEETFHVATGLIGQAPSKLMSAKEAVDFSQQYFEQ